MTVSRRKLYFTFQLQSPAAQVWKGKSNCMRFGVALYAACQKLLQGSESSVECRLTHTYRMARWWINIVLAASRLDNIQDQHTLQGVQK